MVVGLDLCCDHEATKKAQVARTLRTNARLPKSYLSLFGKARLIPAVRYGFALVCYLILLFLGPVCFLCISFCNVRSFHNHIQHKTNIL